MSGYSDPNYSGDPYNPDAYYDAALEYTAPGITQVITEQRAEGESWMDTLERLLTVIIATDTQRQQMRVQLERARSGLPPYDFLGQPGTGLRLTTQTIFLIGGIAFGAYMLLKK